MGTRGLVGLYTDTGWKALWVHFDAYPEGPHGLGAKLLRACRLHGGDPRPVLAHVFSTSGWSAWPDRPHHPEALEQTLYSPDNLADDFSWYYLFDVDDRRLDLIPADTDMVAVRQVDLMGDEEPWGPAELQLADLVPVPTGFYRRCPERLVPMVSRLLQDLGHDASWIWVAGTARERWHRAWKVGSTRVWLPNREERGDPALRLDGEDTPWPSFVSWCQTHPDVVKAMSNAVPSTLRLLDPTVEPDLASALAILPSARLWGWVLDDLWEVSEDIEGPLGDLALTEPSATRPPPLYGGRMLYRSVVGRVRPSGAWVGVPVLEPSDPLALLNTLERRVAEVGAEATLAEWVDWAPGGWAELGSIPRERADTTQDHLDLVEAWAHGGVDHVFLIDPVQGTVSVSAPQHGLELDSTSWRARKQAAPAPESRSLPEPVREVVEEYAQTWGMEAEELIVWIRERLAVHLTSQPSSEPWRFPASSFAQNEVRVRLGDAVVIVPDRVNPMVVITPHPQVQIQAFQGGMGVPLSRVSPTIWQDNDRMELVAELMRYAIGALMLDRHLEIACEPDFDGLEISRWWAVIPDGAPCSPDDERELGLVEQVEPNPFKVGDQIGKLAGAWLEGLGLCVLMRWFGEPGAVSVSRSEPGPG